MELQADESITYAVCKSRNHPEIGATGQSDRPNSSDTSSNGKNPSGQSSWVISRTSMIRIGSHGCAASGTRGLASVL